MFRGSGKAESEFSFVYFRIEQQYQNVLTLWHESHINMKSVVSWHYLVNEIDRIRASNVASVSINLHIYLTCPKIWAPCLEGWVLYFLWGKMESSRSMIIVIHSMNICPMSAVYEASSKDWGIWKSHTSFRAYIFIGRHGWYSVWAYRDGCSLISFIKFYSLVFSHLLKPKIVNEEKINFQWFSIYDY